MLKYIFLLLFATCALAQQCPYTRDQAANCAMRYLDMNKDSSISSTELTYAFNHYLNAMQRALAPTTEQFLRNCDPNGDKLINRAEFDAMAATCMATCQKITFFIQFICLPAQTEYVARTGHTKRKIDTGGDVVADFIRVPASLRLREIAN